MVTCSSCAAETENVVWVPKLPKSALPFCTKPACLRSAQRRAALVFRNHKPRRAVAESAPVS